MSRTQQVRRKDLKSTIKPRRSRSSSKDSKLKTKNNKRKSLKSSNPNSGTRTMTTVRRSARKASAELEFSNNEVKGKKQSEHIKKSHLVKGSSQKRKKSISAKRSQKRKGGVRRKL